MVLSRLPKRSTIIDEESISGMIWGLKYIGFIHTKDKNEKVVYLLTTKKYYEKLTTRVVNTNNNSNNSNQIIPKFINVWYSYGTYCYTWYRKSPIDVTDYVSKQNQKPIIKNICDIFNKSKKCATYICGETGSGKSMVALLLAKKLNASICYEFNPTLPGSNFTTIYNNSNPTVKNPLIIVLEEVDIMLKKIHNNEIKLHKDVPTQIYDKSTYNTFMDFFNRGMFPYTIIVMTSNKNINEINEMDFSYLRNGRIDLHCNLVEQVCE